MSSDVGKLREDSRKSSIHQNEQNILFIMHVKSSTSLLVIALVCIYLHGISIKCLTSNFLPLSRVFFFALSDRLFCIYWVKVTFCKHFFSPRVTVASKTVNATLVHFPYKVKLWLMAHSLNFLAIQKARNAIVGAENLLMSISLKKKSNIVKYQQESAEA